MDNENVHRELLQLFRTLECALKDKMPTVSLKRTPTVDSIIGEWITESGKKAEQWITTTPAEYIISSDSVESLTAALDSFKLS